MDYVYKGVDELARRFQGLRSRDRGEKYRNLARHRSGQHAALVLTVTASGIWVVDQWRNDPGKPKISARLIPPPRHQRNPDGSFPNASNNALAFRVIE